LIENEFFNNINNHVIELTNEINQTLIINENNDTYWDAVSKYELATSKIISISSSFIPGEKYNKAIVTGYVIGVGIKDGTNGDYCAPPEENAYLADDESVYDACEDILAKNYPAYKHQVTLKSDDYLAPGSLLEIPLLGLRGIITANTINNNKLLFIHHKQR
jgi:hypothetical protein